MDVISCILALATITFGIYCAIFFFRQLPSRIYPHCLLVIAYAAYYSTGFIVSYLSLSKSDFRELLLVWFSLPFDVTYALALILIFAVAIHCLCLFAGRFASIEGRQIIQALEALESGKTFWTCALLILLAQISLVVSGSVGYMGIHTETDSYRINPLAQLVKPCANALLLLLGFRLAGKEWRITSIVITIAQLAILVLQGRRILAVGCFCIVFGMLLKGISRLKLFRYGIVSFILLVPGFYGFYALRMAVSTVGKDAPLSEQLRFASQNITSDRRAVSTELNDNLKARPFIIGYLSMLSGSPRNQPGALGEAMWSELRVAIPRAFFPNKDSYLETGNAEAVAVKQFRLKRAEDEPTTLLTTFYVDFREAGIPVACVFFASWLALFITSLRMNLPPLVTIVIFSLCIFECLYIEDGATAWFVAVRNLTLFVISGLLIKLISNSIRSSRFEASA